MARTAQSSNSLKSYELCLRRKPAATTEPTPAANIASSAGSGVVIGGVPGPDGGVPGPDGGVPGPDWRRCPLDPTVAFLGQTAACRDPKVCRGRSVALAASSNLKCWDHHPAESKSPVERKDQVRLASRPALCRPEESASRFRLAAPSQRQSVRLAAAAQRPHPRAAIPSPPAVRRPLALPQGPSAFPRCGCRSARAK